VHRRSLLRRTATLAALSVVGCTGPGGDGAGTRTPGSPTPTDTPMATDTPGGETPSRRVLAASLTVLEVRNGRETDRVTVTVDTDPPTVALRGTVRGSDGCKTATLDGAAYVAGADTLTVAVVTTDRQDIADTACTEAIVEIDYEATVELAGGLPGSVAVTHDGRPVRRVAVTPG